MTRRASILLVALCVALTGFVHGFGEFAQAHQPDAVASVCRPAPGDRMRDDGADAAGAHVHGEHHQCAPGETAVEILGREGAAIHFTATPLRLWSRSIAPPLMPPRA